MFWTAHSFEASQPRATSAWVTGSVIICSTSRGSRQRIFLDALGVSHELFQGLASAARKTESFGADSEAMQTLLELRLLRVFRELQDHNTRRMLIQLAEQIVKRQASPPEAG